MNFAVTLEVPNEGRRKIANYSDLESARVEIHYLKDLLRRHGGYDIEHSSSNYLVAKERWTKRLLTYTITIS